MHKKYKFVNFGKKILTWKNLLIEKNLKLRRIIVNKVWRIKIVRRIKCQWFYQFLWL